MLSFIPDRPAAVPVRPSRLFPEFPCKSIQTLGNFEAIVWRFAVKRPPGSVSSQESGQETISIYVLGWQTWLLSASNGRRSSARLQGISVIRAGVPGTAKEG